MLIENPGNGGSLNRLESQKVSQVSRSDHGADAFACLRSNLSPLRKQGAALLAALEIVVVGQPLYLEFV